MKRTESRHALGRSLLYPLLGLVLFGLLVLLLFLWDPDIIQKIHRLLRQSTPLPLFLALFVFLPLVGFPFSVLLVMAGARLGLGWGLATMVLVIPLHLTGMFGIAKLLRKTLTRLLKRRNISLPSIPETGRWSWIMIFSLIPGLSYTIKNYLLPLVGARNRELLIIVWPVQVVQSAPLVLVGGSVSTGSLAPLAGGVLLLVAFIVLLPRLVRSVQSFRNKKTPSSNVTREFISKEMDRMQNDLDEKEEQDHGEHHG